MVITCIVVLHHWLKHQMEIGVVNYVALVMDKHVLKSLFFFSYLIYLCIRHHRSVNLVLIIFFVSMLITIVFAICRCTDQHSFQMYTVRLLGRSVRAIDRRSALRVLTGLASGGCALTVAWKHTCLQAAKPPALPMPKIMQEDKPKKTLVVDKFDWKLFWYYLKPQIWIIACATAVG